MRYDAKSGITIMLIDTNVKFMQHFSSFLKQRLQWNFILEKEGPHALFTAEKEPVHMFLMETKLNPNCNGFKTLELIKNNAKLSKIPAAFVSSMKDKDTISRARTLGIENYLFKPIDSEEVFKTIIHAILKTVKFQFLVVDNDESVFPIVEQIISKKFQFQYKIFTTTSALTGFNILDEQEINLLILGNNMPTVNGVRMLTMLQERGKLSTLPVIFAPDELTGEERFKVAELELEYFLEKPFQAEEFISTVNKALNIKPLPSL